MRIKFHRIERKEVQLFKSNAQIKAPEVFLIDENGEALGKMSLEKARQLAEEAELDLVELNPKAQPPVVKIVDLGQFKYEKEKQAHRQKMQQKKTETKNIRLSFRISRHDLEMRLDQAVKFLTREYKIKIEMILRGRERQHKQKAIEIINNFVEELRTKVELEIEVEQPLTNQGARFTIILINKASKK